VNDQVDQTFRFMHLDKDGAIRMDCSSECAMAGLLALRDKFDLTIVNDQVDQTFRFMHLDKDGAIRMDCSSECAMAGLLALRD
ncbi:hypothetical protein, partial [Klebsiella pneumoniae]|uniref:hypothetical protein n=1 Tax=Klebsiella pneumoniae TaxID=573 RepID=UPI0010350524